jgi:hypothetical protein
VILQCDENDVVGVVGTGRCHDREADEVFAVDLRRGWLFRGRPSQKDEADEEGHENLSQAIPVTTQLRS